MEHYLNSLCKISISQLVTYSTFCELGSYKKVSARLAISEGNITQQLAKLEEHLGFTLLEREGRKRVMTQDGIRVLKAANNIISELNKINHHALRDISCMASIA